MFRFRPYAFLYMLSLLAGCASTVPARNDSAAAEVDRHIIDAARRIELAQNNLYRSAGGSAAAGATSAGMSGQRAITVAWKGDASQLLRRLAEDGGLQFTQMGVRMPLPVSVDVRGESLRDVLDRIRAQVGYRAVVDDKPGSLVLLYNRPLP